VKIQIGGTRHTWRICFTRTGGAARNNKILMGDPVDDPVDDERKKAAERLDCRKNIVTIRA
jgi:hypothetical protein